METKINEIKKVLDKIRPYIQRDGGDVEFVSYDNGCVNVRMLGACLPPWEPTSYTSGRFLQVQRSRLW